MRMSSRYFMLSGAVGGLLGFLVMELVTALSGAGTRTEDVLQMAVYFGGFGLAVGAALGATEGVVRRKPLRLLYGLFMGLLLGALGGCLGGAAGQLIYSFIPMRYAVESKADIAVALDSSGSMRLGFFFGNDPFGKRRKAARRLINRLSPSDRITVVDFDDRAAVLYPLTLLDSSSARQQAKAAVERVDATGGTNLSAGLATSLAELARHRIAGRPQHIIFLTDGMGAYDPAITRQARTQGVTVFTVGLGSGVNDELLRHIAESTGGKYYPVADASALTTLFESIFSENILMIQHQEDQAPPEVKPLTSPALLFLARIVSWAAMGLVIGAGQGVRENTREDLGACALGGLLGGAIGGALFNPVAGWISLGSGLGGRALADVVVGASIGGSMRLAQERMVEAPGKQTTRLLALLPQKSSTREPGRHCPPPSSGVPDHRVDASSRQRRDRPEIRTRGIEKTAASARTILSRKPSHSPTKELKKPLATYEQEHSDKASAMAAAYRSGAYSLGEIAEHFKVSTSVVRRTIDEYPA